MRDLQANDKQQSHNEEAYDLRAMHEDSKVCWKDSKRDQRAKVTEKEREIKWIVER